MAYSSLNLENIRTRIYTNLLHHLQSSSFKITNSSNIHPAFNNNQYKSEGAPQIIISDIIIDESTLTLGARARYSCEFSLMFHIYHNSAANVRTVADEVHSKFRGDGKQELRKYGFKRLDWKTDDYERVPYALKQSVHIYHLNLTGVFIGV